MENLELLILELVKQPKETTWFEFKLNNENPNIIGQDICALANAASLVGKDKAYIIWGVDDDTHELKGTSFNWKNTKVGNEYLENWLRNNLSNNTNFEFSSVSIEGKWFCIMSVLAATTSTVMFKKEEFIRIGKCNEKLNDYPAIKIHLWGKLHCRNFETLAAKNNLTIIQALDMLDYPSYFTLQNKSIPMEIECIVNQLLEDELLKKQDDGLYTITNMAALLFARRLSDFPTISRKALRVVQFEGKSKINLLKEYISKQGYAIGFSEVMNVMNALLPAREVIKGVIRNTQKSYPEIAVREIILNALIHQDFSIGGTGPVVEIYDNRIEVLNPGRPLIDVERIIESPSKLRNEKLASLMRRLNLSEELGTGWKKIILSCEKMQQPIPKIKVYLENTQVILYSFISH